MASLRSCTALVLEVSLEVLLHVVGSSELLGAADKCALDSLLGGVNLGMTRRMSRGGECLVATMGVAVPARITLARSLGR